MHCNGEDIRLIAFPGSYVSVDEWIDTLVAAVQPGEGTLPSIYEPMYHRFQTGGADAAAALYRELKRDRADALRYCRIALEQKPENEMIAAMLGELESAQ